MHCCCAEDIKQVYDTVTSGVPGDGGLGEVVAVQLAHGQAHVALGVAQLDPLLLEHLGTEQAYSVY